jgi:hypothetical protein
MKPTARPDTSMTGDALGGGRRTGRSRSFRGDIWRLRRSGPRTAPSPASSTSPATSAGRCMLGCWTSRPAGPGRHTRPGCSSRALSSSPDRACGVGPVQGYANAVRDELPDTITGGWLGRGLETDHHALSPRQSTTQQAAMGVPVSIAICAVSAMNCGLNGRNSSATNRSSQSSCVSKVLGAPHYAAQVWYQFLPGFAPEGPYPGSVPVRSGQKCT